jgi:uncharacterized phage infection (PIP) family protein YhgE
MIDPLYNRIRQQYEAENQDINNYVRMVRRGHNIKTITEEQIQLHKNAYLEQLAEFSNIVKENQLLIDQELDQLTNEVKALDLFSHSQTHLEKLTQKIKEMNEVIDLLKPKLEKKEKELQEKNALYQVLEQQLSQLKTKLAEKKQRQQSDGFQHELSYRVSKWASQ